MGAPDWHTWNENPCENISLGGYQLSMSDRAPLAQLMAGVKAGLNEIGSTASALADAITISSGAVSFDSSPLVPAPEGASAATPMFYVRDELRAQVEGLTGGRNTIVYDVHGAPHWMVVVPRFCLEDAVAGSGGSTIHPAFSIGGQVVPEILIGKFLVCSSGGRIATLPGYTPAAGVTLDAALNAARALGPGFAVATNAEQAARRLIAQREGGPDHAPTGNTEYGRSKDAPWQTGLLSVVSAYPGAAILGSDGITLAGTGPQAWTDDGTPEGMADVAGNLREWAPGAATTSNGRFLLIPDNDAHLDNWAPVASEGFTPYFSAARFINAGGTFIDTTTKALTFAPDVSGNIHIASTHNGSNSEFPGPFSALTASGIASIPPLLVALGLAPASFGAHGLLVATNSGGVRHAIRGAGYTGSGSAGLWNLAINGVYNSAYPDVGYRISYIPALGNA